MHYEADESAEQAIDKVGVQRLRLLWGTYAELHMDA